MNLGHEILRHALPGAAVGLGAAGVMGLLGARGDPAGIPAGIGGVFSGGPSGGISGGMLGGMVGAGAVALASVHPGTRRAVASGLVSAMRSRPVRHFGRVVSAIPASVPGAEYRDITMNYLTRMGGMPQHTAMRILERYLTQKSLRRVAMGATAGIAAGALIGGPLGAMRRAYQGGAQHAPQPMLG